MTPDHYCGYNYKQALTSIVCENTNLCGEKVMAAEKADCASAHRRVAFDVMNGLWDGRRQGISTRIRLYLAGRADYPYRLPDEDVCKKRVDWINPHHFNDGFTKTQSRRAATIKAVALHSLLLRFLRTPGKRTATELYRAILRNTLTSEEFVALRQKIIDEPLPDPKLASALAERLAAHSPDRDAVTFGLALMHASPPGRHAKILDVLIAHNRFMWMALWTKVRGMERRQELLTIWETVKKYVLPPEKDPSGVPILQCYPENIHLANPLFDSGIPVISHWLLRGFFKCYLPAYIAYGCAGGGGLFSALRQKRIDRGLLLGAGELLAGMVIDFESAIGEAESNEGAARALKLWEFHLTEAKGTMLEAVALWLNHVEACGRPDLRLIHQMDSLRSFCRRPREDWDYPAPKYWTGKARRDMARRIAGVLAEERWHTLVRKRMEGFADYYAVFHAADTLGIDVWEYRFRAQELGHDTNGYMYLLNSLRKNDAVRKRRILELMEKQINMDAFQLGSDDEEIIRRDGYFVLKVNSIIVSSLSAFPGVHPEYVVAALASPDKRYYLTAADVMRDWDPSLWTDDMLRALRQAIKREPVPYTRRYLRGVLKMWNDSKKK